MSVRVRIAPSPTGEPHIGTAYAALFNFSFAKKEKGKFILRIEDTDKDRLVEGTESTILDSLKWLTLAWDEGPDVGGPFVPYKQSERIDKYQNFANELIVGKKAYFCDCAPDRLKLVREAQQKKGESTHYDRKCRERGIRQSTGVVIRLAVPLDGDTSFNDEVRGKITFQNKEIDDQVLLKSDGFPTYHLASVVDDHLMEISHVIRAEEWLSSTPKHVLLYNAFSWKVPKFIHLPLLRNPDKSKISKRKNPVSLVWYREMGYLPEALLNYLATMGWSMPDDKEIFSLRQFIEKFSFERIDPAGPVFDLQKLEWMNGEYIRKSTDKDLINLLKDYTSRKPAEIEKVLPLIKERIKKLSEFDSLTNYFFDREVKVEKKLIVQKKKESSETTKVLEEISEVLANIEWSKERIEDSIKKYQAKLKWSNTELFQTVRAASTGSLATPPLFETLEVIGRERVVDRLKKAASELSNGT